MLSEMERQDSAQVRLTDEQVAEVRQRMAEPDPKSISLAEARARLRNLGT
jgi:hypothetical protein